MKYSNPTDSRQESGISRLEIKRSSFLRSAPVIIWALAIMLPLLVGSRLHFASLRQNQTEIISQAKQLLMTRSQQFIERLKPDRIARSFFEMYEYERLHAEYMMQNASGAFADLPLVKVLPDFNREIDGELARFSSLIEQQYGFTPEFLLALDEDIDKCGILLSKRLAIDSSEKAMLKNEMARMYSNLNQTHLYPGDAPSELRHFIKFPVFNKTFGILHFFNTRLWRVDERFSARLNRQIYMVTMRYPAEAGKARHLLLGFANDSFSSQRVLDTVCRQLSDGQVKFRTGYARAKELPVIVDSAEKIELICPLPATFENIHAKNTSVGESR